MLKEVILPTLGLDMEEAVIERWLKAEGEAVAKDEPLLIVETEKAATEITAPASGILRQIVQPAGATVPVTHTIAVIEMEGSEAAAVPGPAARPHAPAMLIPSSAAKEWETGGGTVGNGLGSVAPSPERVVRASPAARKAAKELGVDLAHVPGTGPAGRIQGEDVRRFAEGAGPPPAQAAAPAPGVRTDQPSPATPASGQEDLAATGGLPGRLVALGRKRRITAERMSLSFRTVARITLNMELDAGRMMELRARLQGAYEAKGQKLSYDALLVKAVASALSDHPYLNARWTEAGVYLVEPINVGFAVAVEDGLVVPVIRDAPAKALMEVASEMTSLLGRAREDRLTREEMSGGSFTITNLGMFGVDSFTPIVNPPEAAILGVGRIAERPVGREGEIVLRPMMTLSLSVDHRVVDGAPAARFLYRVKELLEEPYLLL